MKNTKKLIISAMLIAIATVLSVIQPLKLPFGGGITMASMVPVILIAFLFGTRWGIFSALIYSLMQMLVGMDVVHAIFMPEEGAAVLWKAVTICLCDYVIAYTVLGLGGIFKNKMKSPAAAVCIGSVFALTLRYITHIISGYIFYGVWAEHFFSQEGFALGAKMLEMFSGNTLAWIYSVIYNGMYMIPEILITAIVAPLIYKALASAKILY